MQQAVLFPDVVQDGDTAVTVKHSGSTERSAWGFGSQQEVF